MAACPLGSLLAGINNISGGIYMQYISQFHSPCGGILLAADQTGLTGLWFEGQKYFAADFSVPLHFTGTDFQNKIWEILCTIPYGETRTYGELAEQFKVKYGRKTSPRAVGSAVGHNRISIIIPCHRVLGADGSLTGYAGGIDRKKMLLELEADR